MFKNKTALIIIGLVICLAIGSMFFFNRDQQRNIQITTEKVSKRTIKETVSASGKIFPEKEVKISSDISGEIVELFVQEGDSVKAGQILGRIDADTYKSQVERTQASVNSAKVQVSNNQAAITAAEAQIAQAEAQYQQVLAQANNARAIHERNKQLFQDGIIAQSEFDNSQSNLEVQDANLAAAAASIRNSKVNLETTKQNVKAAQYNVQSAEASLNEVQTSLNRTKIVAPIDGVISQLNVEQGERVVGTLQMAGTEMMRIANLSSMEVQVDVSENDVLRVSVGDKAAIEIDAFIDQEFDGVVTEIANSASNISTTSLTSDQVTNFVVKIRIRPESYLGLMKKMKRFPFRPGMSASVEINTETKKDVISVPIQAVTTREIGEAGEENIQEVVFLMAADTAQMVEVQTGIQNDKYIEILTGITDGADIVTGPYKVISKEIKAGSKLAIQEETK